MTAIKTVPVTIPVLALRGLTVFPQLTLHFDVGRAASIQALEEAMGENREIFLVTQKELTVENPTQSDLYAIGTVADVKQILRLPENGVRVMVEGRRRGRLLRLAGMEPYLTAEVEYLPTLPAAKGNSPRMEAAIRQVYNQMERYTELSDRVAPEIYLRLLASDDPGYIADYAAQNLPLRFEDKQAVLEELRPSRRLDRLCRILGREVEILEVESELAAKIHEQVASSQRDYFLREQLRVIQRELGEGDEDGEIADYCRRIEQAKLPDEVEQKLLKEVKHLEKQPYGSSEAAVIRTYLDTCLELPWRVKTRERVNVATVSKVLEADHYGLTKVKERILEFVAVRQLAPDLKGQIICLVGPPGVGKTSIAMSVAKAMNRKLARISLGGIRDEADIRGHRKTYVGAMPGRIIAGIRQAGSSNPILLLDEIDKVGNDQRGDPAAALLEVLDSEQNGKFRDHYVELPVDLSEVMFLCTANDVQTIPRPLLDRMEIIEVSSYTENEKLHIAKDHLLPKQMKRHGLKKKQLQVHEKALEKLIHQYTREAGVRNLERKIAAICRKADREILEKDRRQVRVSEKNLEKYLGKPVYDSKKRNDKDEIGIVRGLAWTSVGGDTLEIEVNLMPGKGNFELTGQLGDVMQESAKAGISYIRSISKDYGLEKEYFQEHDIHIHIPEGAVPKDGPSAGITMATAMLSAVLERPVRADVAMTGEITLRGRVLPIGGLKEKLLAAKSAGINMVIVPKKNKRDVEELSEEITGGMEMVYAETMNEVISHAFA